MKKNWMKDKEFVSYVGGLIEKPEIQQLKEFKQHLYSNRLDHSISVSYYSYLLAKRWNANPKEAARAGLMHDLFYYDWRTTKFDEGTHAYMHPRIAAKNAAKLTELTPREKDAIIKHMWGATIAPPRYKEGYIVTLVDKYCAVKESMSPLTNKVKNKWQQLIYL